jgi:hypothetical protein
MSNPAQTQTRFQEDHEHDSKPKRNLKKNAQPAPIGNTSSSPGSWLAEIIVDGPYANLQYASAVEILRSFYKFRSRFRTLKWPIGAYPKPNDIRPEAAAKIFIVDDFETLEDTSLCFGEAQVATPKQVDSVQNTAVAK